jgi:hypothetical protein
VGLICHEPYIYLSFHIDFFYLHRIKKSGARIQALFRGSTGNFTGGSKKRGSESRNFCVASVFTPRRRRIRVLDFGSFVLKLKAAGRWVNMNQFQTPRRIPRNGGWVGFGFLRGVWNWFVRTQLVRGHERTGRIFHFDL